LNSANNKQTFLITGTMGCIGSWVLRNLLDDGANIIATDIDTEVSRPKLLLTDSEIEKITWEKLDVTKADDVSDLVAKHKPTHLIHLAGLQIPFCKASPSLGAAVNVVGTVNLLEAAKLHGVAGVSYASSVGVYGAPENYPDGMIGNDAPNLPNNLYGVYKTANEWTARVYWQDWQLGSIGLRPYTVYGVGRDQGLTADIAKALLAVAANEPFHIRFSGPVALQHANDVARLFIACALKEYQGADVFNLRGDYIDVADVVQLISKRYPDARISYEENNALPFPSNFDDSELQSVINNVPHTAFELAMEHDVEQFKALLASGKLDTSCLKL